MYCYWRMCREHRGTKLSDDSGGAEPLSRDTHSATYSSVTAYQQTLSRWKAQTSLSITTGSCFGTTRISAPWIRGRWHLPACVIGPNDACFDRELFSLIPSTRRGLRPPPANDDLYDRFPTKNNHRHARTRRHTLRRTVIYTAAILVCTIKHIPRTYLYIYVMRPNEKHVCCTY